MEKQYDTLDTDEVGLRLALNYDFEGDVMNDRGYIEQRFNRGKTLIALDNTNRIVSLKGEEQEIKSVESLLKGLIR